MKILAINNSTRLQASSNQSINKNIKQNTTMSDTFEKSNNIAFKGVEKLTREVKIQKLFEYWGEIKKITIAKQQTLSETQIHFEQNLERVHNQINSLTDDLDFVWETIHNKKEGQTWGLAYFNFQKSAAFANKEYEQAEVEAKQSATELINRMRFSKPEEFLANAAEKLKKPEADEKFQKLKALYQQKIDLKKQFTQKTEETAQLFYEKIEPINSKISHLIFDEPSNFQLKAIEEKCLTDKDLNSLWETEYQKHYVKARELYDETKKIESSATMHAYLETLKYLKGGEELAF